MATANMETVKGVLKHTLKRDDRAKHKTFFGSAQCSRCRGLMIVEDSFDVLSGAAPADPVRRCVQCGEIVDLVILQNRRVQLERVLRQAKT